MVQYAHGKAVSVEAALGGLAGGKDEVASAQSHYTRPEEVEEFVKRTGVNSLTTFIGPPWRA